MLRVVRAVCVLSVIVFLVDKGAQAGPKTNCLVFGGLAIMVRIVYREVHPVCLANGRPIALRPPLSRGLPLSNNRIERYKQKSLVLYQARQRIRYLLRRPGDRSHRVTVDPWLCAPVFRRVCLFGFIDPDYSKTLEVFTFHFSNIGLQLCNEICNPSMYQTDLRLQHTSLESG